MARLEQVQGEVYLVAQGAKIVARSGQEVVSGQGVQTVGEDSFAVVVYADGTRLEAGADTILSELSGGQETGKRVFLADGFLTADVSPQPPGQPMLVATPHAEVVILGTRFNLSRAMDATHIEMEKGAVQLTRKSDGQSIEVQTGQAAVVASDAQPMVTQRLAPRLAAVRTIIDAHGRPVHTVRYAPDGRTLASSGRDGTVKLWEAATGEERITLPDHAGPVRSLVFSPDGQTLVAGAGVGAIRVWRLAAEPVGTTLPEPKDDVQGPGDILALALSPDGRSLTVVGRSSGSVYRWEMVPGNEPPVLIGRMGRLGCATLFLKGQVLATGHHRNVVKLWDLTSGQLRDTFRLQEDPSPGPEATALAFAPDGRTLATGSGDGTVRLLDAATGQVRATLLGHTQRVGCVAFSPDGRTLATGSKDRTARLWDMAEGKERATLQGHQQGVTCITFSPDGSTLATGGIDGSLRFWDVPGD